MQYQIYSKNLIVTDSLREYIDIKLERIDKLRIRPTSCRIDVSRDAHHKKGDVFRVEVNVSLPSKLVRIVEQHEDIRAAMDLAADKIIRQIKKFTEKRRDSERKFLRFLKKGKKQ